jgi:hypothetical protein
MQERDDGYAIRLGLLAVVAFMSWPVWLAIVAGQHAFTTTVAPFAPSALALTLIGRRCVYSGRRLTTACF